MNNEELCADQSGEKVKTIELNFTFYCLHIDRIIINQKHKFKGRNAMNLYGN